jgi:hypothetical protein
LVQSAHATLDALEQLDPKPQTQPELCMLFDNLQADWMQSKGILLECWQANCFRHMLHEDEDFVSDLLQICNRLYNFL